MNPGRLEVKDWRTLGRTSAMRLALGFALVQVAALAVALLVLFIVLKSTLINQIESALSGELQTLSALPSAHQRQTWIAGRLATGREAEGRRHYRLEDASGALIAGDLVVWPDAFAADGIVRLTALWLRDEPQDDPERERLWAVGGVLPEGGRLLIAQGPGPLEDLQETALAVAAALFGASALAALVGGWLLGRRWLAQIAAIDAVAARIAAGDLSQRLIPSGRGDELDLLAAHINAMLGRLEQAVAAMRAVADDVAHDLRKPLARLKTRIEVVLSQPRTTETYQETLMETLADIDGLIATFDALLAIARLESGSETAHPVPYDLAALARELGDLYAAQAEEEGRELVLELPEHLLARGVPALVSRALANLLDNAFHHTPPGTPIRVRLAADGAWALLAVNDGGPGIPPAERERLTRRFTRGDQARSRPGTGLGLALAKAVAQAQGGDLELADAPGGGLSARLRLPLHPL